jgi:hypothetical protein
MNDELPLKNCPFCGGKPMEFVEDSCHVIKCNSGPNGAHYAGCDAMVRRALLPAYCWWGRVLENREAWNKGFERSEV